MQTELESIYRDFCRKLDEIILRLEQELKSPDQNGESDQGKEHQ